MQILQVQFQDYVPKYHIFVDQEDNADKLIQYWQEPTTLDGQPVIGFMAETYIDDLPTVGFKDFNPIGNVMVWQSFLGAGIDGKPIGLDKISLSFWIMSSASLNSACSWRSHSRSTAGAMHGVKLIIAPHMTVLAESANAQFG